MKFVVVKLHNHSGRPRRLSLTGYWELVLGEWRHANLMHIVTETDPHSGALFARNAYGRECADRVVFAQVSEPERRSPETVRNSLVVTVHWAIRRHWVASDCLAGQVPVLIPAPRSRPRSNWLMGKSVRLYLPSARLNMLTKRTILSSASAARPAPARHWRPYGDTGTTPWARCT